MEQECSSMESSLYENWDEIEMLFGHLVNSNLQLVIAITIAMVFNWTDQSVRLECLSWKIGESESQSVLISQRFLADQSFVIDWSFLTDWSVFVD